MTGIVDTIFGEFEMKYASTAVGNICEETKSLIGLVLGEYSWAVICTWEHSWLNSPKKNHVKDLVLYKLHKKDR